MRNHVLIFDTLVLEKIGRALTVSGSAAPVGSDEGSYCISYHVADSVDVCSKVDSTKPQNLDQLEKICAVNK